MCWVRFGACYMALNLLFYEDSEDGRMLPDFVTCLSRES